MLTVSSPKLQKKHLTLVVSSQADGFGLYEQVVRFQSPVCFSSISKYPVTLDTQTRDHLDWNYHENCQQNC